MLKLTRDEVLYCLAKLNGFLPEIDLEEETETVVEQLLSESVSLEMPRSLPAKLTAMGFWQRVRLYCHLNEYWDCPESELQDTDKRLETVGLVA